jgi:hypothetical protein
MSVDESAVSRTFVANPGAVGIGPNWSPKSAYLKMYGFVGLLIAVIALSQIVPRVLGSSGESMRSSYLALGLGFLGLVGVLLALSAYYRRHNRQKIVIGVASDGLTVNKRRGDVFPFSDVTLGPWGWGAGTMGTALHLRSASHRFVLGGRDRRADSGIRLDEPAVPGVDAWLPAAEFEQLLGMVTGRAGLDIRPPTPGAPSRYTLFPNPQRVQANSPSEVRKQHELLQSASNLAIDVDADSMRVTDLTTNALIASAALTDVTATPATYEYPYRHLWPTPENVMTDVEMKRLSKAPELILGVPGMEPLAIACLDTSGGLGITRRFSWPDGVAVANEPAQYAVSSADWLELVEKFSLAPQAESGFDAHAAHAVPQVGQWDQLVPRSRGPWGTIVGFALASIAVMALGAFFVGVQHFGVPERILVQICPKPDKRQITDFLFTSAVGNCAEESNGRRVEFWGAYPKDVGHVLAVHTRGSEAFVDGWIGGPAILAVGLVLGAGTGVAIARRLRPAST